MYNNDDNKDDLNKKNALNWDVFDQLQRERSTVAASIDTILNFSSYSSALEEITTEKDMFIKVASKIDRIYDFNAMAFYGINRDDQDFYLSYCNSPGWVKFIEENRIDLIVDGTFSWLLERERPVILSSSEENFKLFASPLATRKRIMGVFIAVMDKNKTGIGDISNSFLSLILRMTSTSIQNLDLYNLVQELNKNLNKKVYNLTKSEVSLIKNKGTLEDTVRKRTQALEKANIDLISEKRKVEKANRAKSIFLSNMSHEIRTPISQMIGMNELVLNVPEISNIQREYLVNSRSAGKSILSLVDNLLEVSTLETGKVSLINEDCNIRNIFSNVIDKVIDEEKSDTIKIIIDEKIPSGLNGDSSKLERILLHLVNNAVKFTEEGNITLTGKLIKIESGKATIQLSVKDTGVGISLEKQEFIFDTFFQGDSSRSKKYGGAGLGLAISKKLVELMKGKIWVESFVGKGSNFIVQLTFTILDDLVEMTGQNLKKGGVVPEGLSVLLVEDNVLNRKLAQAIIKDLNWNIDEAQDGFEAVKAVQSKKYDLILMDIQMPGMNGIEATRKIREIELNNLHKTIILALTANATTDDRSVCMEAGMDEYLTKPINKSKMIQLVGDLLNLVSSRKG